MILGFLKSVGLAIVMVAGPATWNDPELRIGSSFARALLTAQDRAERTNNEEYYCLKGSIVRNHFVITAVVKPEQEAAFRIYYDHDTDQLTKQWTVFVPAGCPVGTIADFHTHPGTSPVKQYPSRIDEKAWRKNGNRFHIISYDHEGENRFNVFVQQGEKFVLHEKVVIF